MPLLGWIFRTAKAIPIAPAKEDPWLMEKAFIDIAQALHEGDLVCIFPEGKLTSTGEMNEFKGGIAKIVERSKVPVIPMALRGLWGHLLSRKQDHVFDRAFRKGWRSRLALAVGQPVAPHDVTPELLHAQVAQLRGDWK
jgi:1-acyl-sn-glycerol-3-phosphate acyltransferase